jgi:RNA-directed DNA polymerase
MAIWNPLESLPQAHPANTNSTSYACFCYVVGGVISPVLANIFLHHVLDKWFVDHVRPRLKGRCFIVRFADDFVIGTEREDDAKRLMEVLPKRFAKYGLDLHPEKTKLLEFRKPSPEATSGDNTFDFLGFTHYWSRSRNGNWVIKRKTSAKKVCETIQSLREWCRINRHMNLEEQYRILSSKLRGHFQYFGIRCNMRAMEAVLHHAIRNWKFWLNRRSRKKALNWDKFRKLLEQMPLPIPRIVHNI